MGQEEEKTKKEKKKRQPRGARGFPDTSGLCTVKRWSPELYCFVLEIFRRRTTLLMVDRIPTEQ
jgi:hypothetical protein